jgi:hypothetical protein
VWLRCLPGPLVLALCLAVGSRDAGADEPEVEILLPQAAPAVVEPAQPAPPEEVAIDLSAPGVLVLVPPPEPEPAAQKLRGGDIRYHDFAAPRRPTAITYHGFDPDAPARIDYHDWRTADSARIPYAQNGQALASQSWNPRGARYEPSRIRYHTWLVGGR